MLVEQFVASIGIPSKTPGTNVTKDAAIFLHEHQPLAAQRALFKKSATPPSCLAISSTHIFAAQTEKAVVHVYNREKGSQEATVPFTERIVCLTLACEDAVLILGTKEGRIFLWELATGRQVTTSQSHLQAVTSIAVDAASHFLISASADSTCHVWSIPALLSFSNSGAEPLAPLHTFSNHRSEICAVKIGQSKSFQNIAITAAKDKTCLVWDYHTNAALRTYLLPDVPTCLALDAADRAFYVGYENGGVQRIDFFGAKDAGLDGLQNNQDATTPIQPRRSIWTPSDKETGSVLSLDASFDGTAVLCGHQSGAVFAWDVATGHVKSAIPQGPLPGPIMNISFLPVSGFTKATTGSFEIEAVVKPKFGAFQESNLDTVPGNYALNARLSGVLSGNSSSQDSAFQMELRAPCFSADLLDEGLSELASWGQGQSSNTNGDLGERSDDFMALDELDGAQKDSHLRQQNDELKAQLNALRKVQTASFSKIELLQAERQALLKREQKRVSQKAQNGSKLNGNAHEVDESDDEMTSSSDEN